MVNRDLLDFSDYLNSKYNMNTYVSRSKVINYKSALKMYILKIILFTILLVVLGIMIHKYKKNIILIIVYIIIIFIYIISITINIISKNTIQNKIKFIKDNKKLQDFSDFKFKTGDIFQSINNFHDYNTYLSLHLLFGFLHNFILIEFRNKFYLMHIINENFGYDIDSIYFKNNKHLIIDDLNEYINYERTLFDTVYRVIPVNRSANPKGTADRIDTDKILDIVNINFNNSKINFSFNPILNFFSIEEYYNKCFNNINCCNIIIKILYMYGIIKINNFNNITSDDLILLKYWSNNVYTDPIYFYIEKSTN